MFTTKHVLLVAKIIRNNYIPTPYKKNLVLSFMQFFKEDNYLYDRRFHDIAMSILPEQETITHINSRSCMNINKYMVNKPILLHLFKYNNYYFWTKNTKLTDCTFILTLTLPYNIDLDQCGFNLQLPKEFTQ